jgi:hypothetical protein
MEFSKETHMGVNGKAIDYIKFYPEKERPWFVVYEDGHQEWLDVEGYRVCNRVMYSYDLVPIWQDASQQRRLSPTDQQRRLQGA